MFYSTLLPAIPVESATDNNGIFANAFVDDQATGEIIDRWSVKPRQDQAFFGEDFAGREDVQPMMKKISFHCRRELGPFYSQPIAEETPIWPLAHRPKLRSSSVERILQQERVRRHGIIATAAAAILLSLSFLGAGISAAARAIKSRESEKIGASSAYVRIHNSPEDKISFQPIEETQSMWHPSSLSFDK